VELEAQETHHPQIPHKEIMEAVQLVMFHRLLLAVVVVGLVL
jgi:hypothetical protein